MLPRERPTEPEADEAALVFRLRQGEPAAFDAAYQRHKRSVHRFLRRLTGRDDLADDLFQETWLRLARGARSLREDTRLLPWLFTVARNLHVSHARARATDRAREEGAAAAERWSPETPLQVAVADQAARRLEQALAQLPLPQREAILLCAIERMDPADAARVVDVSPEAFRQRLARGRALLRQALSAGDDEVT